MKRLQRSILRLIARIPRRRMARALSPRQSVIRPAHRYAVFCNPDL